MINWKVRLKNPAFWTGLIGVLGTFAIGIAQLLGFDISVLADGWQQVLGLIVLWGLAFAFVYCTFRPPQLALWQDPITMTRGIP
mgnify:CR=1 FL=1